MEEVYINPFTDVVVTDVKFPCPKKKEKKGGFTTLELSQAMARTLRTLQRLERAIDYGLGSSTRHLR